MSTRLLPADPGSSESLPEIACSTSAQSSAERQIGPILSSVEESAIAPRRLTSPYVGRRPVTPQYALGVRIDPEVSEPSANVTNPAEVAAADPLDDPPLQRVRSHGFNPGPVCDAEGKRYPPPPASSTMASLPIRIAPAFSSLSTTRAFSSNTWPANGFAPHVVGWPFTASRSFRPKGMPCKGPRVRSRFRSPSTSLAWRSAS